MKFLFLFFWTIGIAGLYILIQVTFMGDGRIILTNFQNPLIKYAIPLFGLNMCIVLFLIPIFIHRGVISPTFYDADKYTKAKAEFIILSMSTPGWVLLTIAGYHLTSNSKSLYILVGFLIFIYFSSILTLLMHNK